MENILDQNTRSQPLRAAGKMLVPLSCGALSLLAVVAIVPAIPSIATNFTQHGALNGRFLAQMVLIIAALSAILGAPAVAIAAKRFGKRPTLLAMLLLYAASGSVGLFEPTFWPLLLSRVVLGFTAGALGMLCLVLITDYYHGPLRFRLLGISGTVQLAALILALILCGGIVDKFGWGAAFAIYPVTGLLTLIVAWFCIIEPPASTVSKTLEGQTAGLLRKLAPVYPIYALIMIYIIAQFSIAIDGPFLLIKLGVTKASIQGLITALPNIAAMLSSLFFGALHERLTERQLVIPAFAIIGAGTAALTFSFGLGAVAFCYIAIGLASGITIPAAATMIIARALPDTREAALGLILSVAGVSQFLNPIVTAPITHFFGIRGAFLSLGVMMLITVAVMAAGSFGRSTARLEKAADIADTLV
jgi:MFS family permease